MDEPHLSDTFQRYFSDVFLCCDEENSGKATINRTIDLIKSGNVPEAVIGQIADICWTPGTNNLNKKQFFSALKLVAAYQANLPVRNDLLTSKVDLPLPRFTWSALETVSPIPDLIELRNEAEFNTDSISTDSEADSETVRCSPDISSPASDSPTPTNSVQDRNWAWQGLVSEEQRQLLEEESSDKHSSDDDTEVSNEVWIISPEQRDYYTAQFKKLQENTNALLAGSVARTFFERSNLPVNELRKIWQLADVTKDGALSLQEFNTAMHLVVLQKHKIPVPDILPPSLIPQNESSSPPPPPVSPLKQEPVISSPIKDGAKEWTKFVESPTSNVSSPGIKPVNFDFQIDQNDPDLRHPVPRRLTPDVSSSIVVNSTAEDVPDTIDLHSPKRDGSNNIQPAAPIPIQATSTAAGGQSHSAIQRPQPKSRSALLGGPGAIPPPPVLRSAPEETVLANQQAQTGILNNQTIINQQQQGGPVSLPAFPPPKKEKPPPPPPRPFKTHGRSSSLDLNRLSKPAGPPVVPPRVSPSSQSKKLINQRSEGDHIVPTEDGASFADFNRFEKYENVEDETIFPGDLYEAERKKLFTQLFSQEPVEEAPRKHGAFEVYRKPSKPASGDRSPLDALEEEQWEEFERLQIENTALLRTCQELSQQLADLKEDKMKLKVKLEQLGSLENGG